MQDIVSSLLFFIHKLCAIKDVILIFLRFVFDRLAAQRLDQRVQKALFIFACTNSCVNPLVYGIFNFCQKRKPQVSEGRLFGPFLEVYS